MAFLAAGPGHGPRSQGGQRHRKKGRRGMEWGSSDKLGGELGGALDQESRGQRLSPSSAGWLRGKPPTGWVSDSLCTPEEG